MDRSVVSLLDDKVCIASRQDREFRKPKKERLRVRSVPTIYWTKNLMLAPPSDSSEQTTSMFFSIAISMNVIIGALYQSSLTPLIRTPADLSHGAA